MAYLWKSLPLWLCIFSLVDSSHRSRKNDLQLAGYYCEQCVKIKCLINSFLVWQIITNGSPSNLRTKSFYCRCAKNIALDTERFRSLVSSCLIPLSWHSIRQNTQTRHLPGKSNHSQSWFHSYPRCRSHQAALVGRLSLCRPSSMSVRYSGSFLGTHPF